MPHMANLPWLPMFTSCILILLTMTATYNFQPLMNNNSKKNTLNKQDKKNPTWKW